MLHVRTDPCRSQLVVVVEKEERQIVHVDGSTEAREAVNTPRMRAISILRKNHEERRDARANTVVATILSVTVPLQVQAESDDAPSACTTARATQHSALQLAEKTDLH